MVRKHEEPPALYHLPISALCGTHLEVLGGLGIGVGEPTVGLHQRLGLEAGARQLRAKVRADDELVVEGRVVLEKPRQQVFYKT